MCGSFGAVQGNISVGIPFSCWSDAAALHHIIPSVDLHLDEWFAQGFMFTTYLRDVCSNVVLIFAGPALSVYQHDLICRLQSLMVLMQLCLLLSVLHICFFCSECVLSVLECNFVVNWTFCHVQFLHFEEDLIFLRDFWHLSDEWLKFQICPDLLVLGGIPASFGVTQEVDQPFEPVYENEDGTWMLPLLNYKEKRADW